MTGSWQRTLRESWVTATICAIALLTGLLGLVTPINDWLVLRGAGDRHALLEPWRPITANLAGGSNVFWLLLIVAMTGWIGIQTERQLGHTRTALVAIAGSVGTSAALVWMSGLSGFGSLGVGAIGFAWLAAQLVTAQAHGLPIRDQALMLALMIGFSVVSGGIGSLAILGGLAAAIACGLCIAHLRPGARRRGNVASLQRARSWTVREWGMLGVIVLAYVLWALRHLL